MTSHETVVGAYVYEGDVPGEFRAGIEVVCECGAILLDEDEDELLPFSEIASSVRDHPENADAQA
jgi:hypothetical protein